MYNGDGTWSYILSFLTLKERLILHFVGYYNNWFFPKEYNSFERGDISYLSQVSRIYLNLFYSPLACWIFWWHIRTIYLATNFISMTLEIPGYSFHEFLIVVWGLPWPLFFLRDTTYLIFNIYMGEYHNR